MEEDNERVTIKGSRIELPEGRSVAVGRVDGKEEYYVMMVNKEGDETNLKLSPEATEALRDLLDDSLGNNGWIRKDKTSA